MINSIFYFFAAKLITSPISQGSPLPSPFFETEQHAIHDWNPDVFGEYIL
jgi:hypothetical protein